MVCKQKNPFADLPTLPPNLQSSTGYDLVVQVPDINFLIVVSVPDIKLLIAEASVSRHPS